MKRCGLLLYPMMIVAALWTAAPAFAVEQSAESLCAKGDSLADSGDFANAAQMFGACIATEQAAPAPRENVIVHGLTGAGRMSVSLGKFAEALKYYDAAIEIVRKAGAMEEVALLLYVSGRCHAALGEIEPALANLEESLAINRKLGLEEDAAGCLMQLGETYVAGKQVGKGIEQFQQALGIYQKLGKDGDAATCLINMAKYYNELQQNDLALTHFEAALVIEKRLGNEQEEATIYYTKGLIYLFQKRFDAGISDLEQALQLSKKLNNEPIVADILLYLGMAYLQHKKPEKGIASLEEALTHPKWQKPDTPQLARIHDELASAYMLLGRLEEAIKHFEQSVALCKAQGQEERLAERLNLIAEAQKRLGRYQQAIDRYQEALAIYREKKDDAAVCACLNDIGITYRTWGHLPEAEKTYLEALALAQRLGNEDLITTTQGNLGRAYEEMGRYDVALKYLEGTLAYARKIKDGDRISLYLNNIGMIYKLWGRWDDAFKYFEEALGVEKKLGRETKIPVILNNLGQASEGLGQVERAMHYYEEALAIDRRLGQEEGISRELNNLGALYKTQGKDDQAIKYYQESIEIVKRLGHDSEKVIRLNNLSNVIVTFAPGSALIFFEEALQLARKLGMDAESALILSNMGSAYWLLNNYGKAIENLERAVEIYEKIRKTATGDVRRDYLASEIDNYEILVSAYLRARDFPNALKVLELSRAKLLSERLSGSESAITLSGINEIQSGLADDGAIISYTALDKPFAAAIVITRNGVFGVELDREKFLARAEKEYKAPMEKVLKGQRGVRLVSKEPLPNPAQAKKISFGDVVSLLRSRYTDPSAGGKEGDTAALDGLVYDYLVAPIAGRIKGKKQLIIVPDDALAFLPFEALRGPEGRYLVQDFSVGYAQSASILELLKRRSFAPGRKPMLAFGGAVYEQPTNNREVVNTKEQLRELEKEVGARIASRGSLKDAYASLGVTTWNNLPGTLSEVKGLAAVVSGATILSGAEVSENRVKALSASGELARYQVLHFATHGLVVPQLPELSALVLSQNNRETGEDGYLRMEEIAGLKLQADFVNLSACETGLGKIYGGEGVVGLTQAFILAGANGLSASLWQVADDSTAKFMVALYDLVQKKGVSYSQGVNEVKRRFIAGEFGDGYRAPYYWAPFVYYGRSDNKAVPTATALSQQATVQTSTGTAPPPSTCDYREPVTGMEFVLVPGGSFQMGDPKAMEFAQERAHQVTLSPFYMAKFHVTQKQWEQVMGNNPSEFKGEDLPVERVSWHDCQQFFKKLNALSGKKFRLPTEAEWEYAARSGGKDETYSGTSDNARLDEYSWHQGNSDKRTHPDWLKKPNGLGLYQMPGNVFEWVQDWFGDYPKTHQKNPTGPPSGKYKVYRGGSHRRYFSGNLHRSEVVPTLKMKATGFRVVLAQ